MPSPHPADDVTTTEAADGRGSGGKAIGITAVVLVLVLGAVLLAVKYWPQDGSSGPGPTAGPSASPTSSADAARDQAAEQALAAFNAYQESFNAAAADPAKDLPLKGAGSPLRLQASVSLKQLADNGLAVVGTPKHDVRVAEVNLAGTPPYVQLVDCRDANGSKTIDKATGQNRSAPDQLPKYIVRAKAEKYGDGRWLISTLTPERKSPC
ncbi:hypothetical protein GCM10010123_19460 [Pilimelia anulata]|uniref:Uncharacterized protein n=1 Tax=Pilimelia anulata TaxID=53371 RepID=A0A8J3B376_9ACTN|nr:hypothetical protein [Pilimelia anulata]GGJ89755.1 hypothetical protein GCM10010123_19460 [Pilimelia anulata]